MPFPKALKCGRNYPPRGKAEGISSCLQREKRKRDRWRSGEMSKTTYGCRC